MAFGTFELTGHIDGLDGAPAVGPVKIEALPSVLIDTAGNKLKIGPKTVYLDKLGDFSIGLPTNSTTGDSTGIAYRVRAEPKGLTPADPVEFYAKAIGETLDLSDITPVGPLDPIYPATQAAVDAATARDDAQIAQTAAEFAAAAAAAVGDTNDAIIAGVVDDPDSDTRAVLDPLIASLGGGGGGGGGGDIDASAVVSGTLASARIPDLDAAKINAGVIGTSRIPNLDAAKIVSGVLPAARIPDLSTLYAAQSAVAAVADQQTALMEVAASTEELSVSSYVNGRWSSGTFVQTLGASAVQHIVTGWIAPWPCSILSLDALIETNNVSTDNTNYLTLEVRRCRAGTGSLIALKTTKTTGGEALTARVAWSFDGASWDAGTRVFAKGDALQLRWVATGTATLTYPFSYTFRVQPS